jgi:hypothetical protein
VYALTLFIFSPRRLQCVKENPRVVGNNSRAELAYWMTELLEGGHLDNRGTDEAIKDCSLEAEIVGMWN